MDKTWKRIERRVAELLGGVRVPVSGRQRGDSPDVIHPVFSVEVKHREKLPEWLFDAMRQAEASKRGEQVPLVILHQKSMPVPMSFAVVRFSDLMTMNKKLEER
jgi:hypothetical protein